MFLTMPFGLRLADFCKRLLILFAVGPGIGQAQEPFPGCGDQFSRDKEKLCPDRLNRVLFCFLIQCLFLEKVHQIVAEHQQLKPSAVTGPAVGDHLIQAETVHSLFDKVLTASPLIVKPPDLFGGLFAVARDDLVVIQRIVGMEKLKLLPRGSTSLNHFPDDHHPQGEFLRHDVFALGCLHPTAEALPFSDVADFTLNPFLQRHHDIELNAPALQKLDHLTAEKPTVRPKPEMLDVAGQSLDHGLQKAHRLIRGVMFPTPQKPSEVVSRLAHKAQQSVIALAAFLLRIVSQSRTLLMAIDRCDMRIQIQRQVLPLLETFAELHQKIKMEGGHILGHCHLQRRQKPADRRLHRKSHQPRYLLKHLVSRENPHLVRPRKTQKHPIKTTNKHRPGTVFALSSTLDAQPIIEARAYFMTLEEASNKAATAKGGQILAAEAFPDPLLLPLAIILFCGYTLFHFLSASSIVFKRSLISFSYYSWGTFV
jgi:hypothetical protein